MGKPYEKELSNLNQTYQWALKEPIEELRYFVKVSFLFPLIAIGSGGSLTAAHVAALLHQNTGMISKGVTPLLYARQYIRNYSLLIISSGGRNKDILNAFRFAITSEPRQLMGLCMRPKSPLYDLFKKFSYTYFQDFKLPCGKDGFLATNSLLALVTILIRAYSEVYFNRYVLPQKLLSGEVICKQLNISKESCLGRDTWVVLFGGWGFPAAIDVESKFTEAALSHVQISDYRNFAHGRHHWLARKEKETGIIALITPDERGIANRTFALLPKNIPIIRLTTDISGPIGCLDLLVKVMYLVNQFGAVRNIDPGRPSVPIFGRQIYHLSISKQNKQRHLSFYGLGQKQAIAIIRKCRRSSLAELNDEELRYWKNSYESFINRINKTLFGSIVLDYDGTLCLPLERFIGPSKKIVKEIIRLLKCGAIIGIATGRGKSVRKDLQKSIPKKYWKQILIGYYNASDIGLLEDTSHPKKVLIHPAIKLIKDLLKEHPNFCRMAACKFRSKQITVELFNISLFKEVRDILIDVILKTDIAGIKLLESSHSIDIVAPGVSKLHLVTACKEAAKKNGRPGAVLCIGDKGEWPGNDYELLSTPYSISVNDVSPDPKNCWNISQAGHRGVQASLEHLKMLRIYKGALRYTSEKGKGK